MKKQSIILAIAIALMGTMSAAAQQKVADSAIVGMWYNDMFQYEREEPLTIDQTNLTTIKVYGADGEYVSAHMYISKDHKDLSIQIHEYGTYSLKDGMYSEMGRTPIKMDWVNDSTSLGRWQNRKERWRKVKNCPKEMMQFVLELGRLHHPSKELEHMFKKNIFGVEK